MNRNESFPGILVSTLKARLGWASLDVTVEDVDQLQVVVSGSDQDVQSLRVQCVDNCLVVEQPAWGISFRGPKTERWLQIMIRLPRSWKGAVDLRSLTAPLKAHGLTGTDLAFSTFTGALTVGALHSMTVSLRTFAGDVVAEHLEGERLSIGTAVGDVSVMACGFEDVQCHAMSGRIDLDFVRPFGRFAAIAGSGDIRLFAPMNKADVSLRSLRGRLHTRGVSIQPDAPETRITSFSGNFEINCSYAATYEEE